MSIEAMKLALEAMEYADACLKKQLTTKTKHEYAQDLLLEAGTALRQAIAEASENGLYREGYRNGYGFGEAAGLRQAIEQAQKQEPVGFETWYENAIWGNEDFKAGCKRAWNAAIKHTTPPQRQPEQEPVAWSEHFEAWWNKNRVDAHKIKNAGGFARKVWKASLDSVAGATDSTTGFYPVDGGSIPPRQTTPPQRQPLTDERLVSVADELPKGLVPLQKENGRLVYAACMDSNASHYKWLMWRHPDGQWVSKRKLEDWEVMQVEDQEHYGIVQEVAHGIKEKNT